MAQHGEKGKGKLKAKKKTQRKQTSCREGTSRTKAVLPTNQARTVTPSGGKVLPTRGTKAIAVHLSAMRFGGIGGPNDAAKKEDDMDMEVISVHSCGSNGGAEVGTGAKANESTVSRPSPASKKGKLCRTKHLQDIGKMGTIATRHLEATTMEESCNGIGQNADFIGHHKSYRAHREPGMGKGVVSYVDENGIKQFVPFQQFSKHQECRPAAEEEGTEEPAPVGVAERPDPPASGSESSDSEDSESSEDR